MKKGYITNIEKATKENEDFREVVYTAENCQLVLMSLKPGQEIGNEVHHVDQFFRFEEGTGEAILNNHAGVAGERHEVKDGTALIVPAGTWHNIVNTSKTKALKLYTLYSPPHHKDGVRHVSKESAEKDRADIFKGMTTEHNE